MTHAHDIALLELENAVPKSEEVQYLCLNPYFQLRTGDTVQAIGWGSADGIGSGKIMSHSNFKPNWFL